MSVDPRVRITRWESAPADIGTLATAAIENREASDTRGPKRPNGVDAIGSHSNETARCRATARRGIQRKTSGGGFLERVRSSKSLPEGARSTTVRGMRSAAIGRAASAVHFARRARGAAFFAPARRVVALGLSSFA